MPTPSGPISLVPATFWQWRWQATTLVALAVLPQIVWLNNYYFIDDGLALELARRVQDEGVREIFARGFNGHIRPLPLASWWALTELCGAHSPVPFHALSLLLHTGIVLLSWTVLRRLLGPDREGFAWAACAVFAMHCVTTEAVTYLSALGVLWSMLGGFLACLGILLGYAGRRFGGAAFVFAGVLIALGGGEYSIATAPILGMVLIWRADWRQQWRWTAAASAIIIGLFGLYVLAEIHLANHGRLGTSYAFGTHVVNQFRESIGRLTFPNGWIGVDLCNVLLVLFLGLGLLTADVRRFLISRVSLALFLASAGSVLPFVPTKLGNYGRFLYIGAPFFTAWLLLFCSEMAAHWTWTRRRRAAILATGFAVLLVAHLIHNERRACDEWQTGQRVRQVVERCERLRDEHPDRTLQVWIARQSHHVQRALFALDLIAADNIHFAACPRSPRPAGEDWLVISADPQGVLQASWQVTD